MSKYIPPGRILAKQKFLDKKKRIYSRGRVSIAAEELGRMGGMVGGYARAEALDADRRYQIAVHAACARWQVECYCGACDA